MQLTCTDLEKHLSRSRYVVLFSVVGGFHPNSKHLHAIMFFFDLFGINA